MPNLYKGAFLLRDLSTALNSLAPRDKIAVIVRGTNSGGAYDIDLSDLVNPGATVSYVQLATETISAAGLLDSDNDAPGDDIVVDTLVIIDQKDLKMDG